MEWATVYLHDGKKTESILEFTGINEVQFWGSISLEKNEDGFYELCAFSKDRILMTVEDCEFVDETVDSAKSAIEEFLIDEGILDNDK